MIPVDTKLPTRFKLIHGFGSIAYGIKENGFSTFLLIFYNQVIGLDAKAVSFALMIALVVDAFGDPVIGYLSDRTHTRWGRRLPWLYVAPIPLAFAWTLLWYPPSGLGNWIFAYLIGMAILIRTLISCCEVPSISLIPELTRDYDERTSLMRFRYLFGWTGALIVAWLAYSVFLVPDETYKIGQLNPNGYFHYGLFGAALMSSAVLLSAAGQHRRVAKWPARRLEGSVGAAFADMRKAYSHPAFLILMGAGILSFTAQGVTITLINYLALYVWGFSKADFTTYVLILFVSVVIAFFVVTPISRRFGKKHTAAFCGMIGTLIWCIPFVLRLLGEWPAFGDANGIYMFFGFALAANTLTVTTMICGSSMVAELVEASEVETGKRTEGLFYAGGFFMQKCSAGLGVFASGMIVGLSGFPSRAIPGQVSTDILDRMTVGYVVTTLILVMLSTSFFLRFPIGRADHVARVRQLAARDD
jgi:glycoside/pentoside/hexuronide:cation symporter, GPH family